MIPRQGTTVVSARQRHATPQSTPTVRDTGNMRGDESLNALDATVGFLIGSERVDDFSQSLIRRTA